MKSLIKYIISLLLIGIIVMGNVMYEPAKRPLAFVQEFKPSVAILNNGQLNNIKERGKPLFDGDTLQTNQNGFALVQFMDKSLAKVKPNSRLIVRGEVEGKESTSTQIGLELGEIYLNVSEQGSDDFEIATGTSVATVKGTEFGATADDYFWVKEGEVEVTVGHTGETVRLTDRSYGQVQEDGTIAKGELSEEQIEQRDEEYARMNEQTDPEIYEVRFINGNGQERVIELKVFENDNQ